jgi:hypothetical protein
VRLEGVLGAKEDDFARLLGVGDGQAHHPQLPDLKARPHPCGGAVSVAHRTPPGTFMALPSLPWEQQKAVAVLAAHQLGEVVAGLRLVLDDGGQVERVHSIPFAGFLHAGQIRSGRRAWNSFSTFARRSFSSACRLTQASAMSLSLWLQPHALGVGRADLPLLRVLAPERRRVAVAAAWAPAPHAHLSRQKNGKRMQKKAAGNCFH